MKTFISILFIAIFLVSGILAVLPQQTLANSTYVPWYNSSWLYRKSFNVIGSADGTQTNYQLKVYCYYGAGTDTGFVLREPTASTYTADAGTNTTTIVDTQILSSVDSYYVGAKVYNQTRSLWSVVTAYVAATKTLTISPAIAAQTTADLYYLYEIPPVVYFNAKCKSDFTDLIFTRNDGTTTLDYWIESYTASNFAVIWVEFNTITLPPTTNTFWVYYGNPAATSVSNGTNTFIVFDDFERGVNGDAVGGAWTVGTPQVLISTDHDSTPSGTRSAKVVGQAGNPEFHITQTAGSTYGVHFKLWKETAVGDMYLFDHGSGVKEFILKGNVTEDILYLNSVTAFVDTLLNFIPDAWSSFAIYNFNFTSGTSTFAADGVPFNIPNTFISAGTPNQVLFVTIGAGVGNDAYYDDYFVTKYTVNEPRWSTFTTEVSVGPTQTIQDVAVFKSFLTTGDWLFTIRYLDTYYPYYDTADIKQYFVFQLLNLAGTVVAQTPAVSWGNKVGCVYLSPSLAASLEWGQSYTIRMYGLFSGNPSNSWTLSSPNWQGSDLTYLDSWVISSAGVIQTYYYVQPSTTSTTSGTTTTTTSGTAAGQGKSVIMPPLLVYIATKGQVLNATGAAVFDTGIPGLSQVRPNIFQISTTHLTTTSGTFTQTYRNSLTAWQTNIGPDGTIMLTRLGNLVGVQGNLVSTFLFLLMMIIMAVMAFPAGATLAANILSIPFLFAGIFFGFDLLYLLLLGLFAAFLLAKKLFMDTGN